jgi:cysteine desulfurase
MREAYLDNSATTPVCRAAAEKAMEMMLENYGNPSSLHTKGIEAQRELDRARSVLAGALKCRADELTFTSGATEANNLALLGGAYARRRRGERIVISAVSHSSVMAAAAQLEKEGFEVVRIGTDAYGRIDPAEFAAAITPKTILTSMELVNNETGAIQPVSCMARAVKKVNAPALIHIDAVQAFGKIAVSPQKLGAHLLSVSAHKIRGPKGVGALYVQHGTHLLPRVYGGEQERKLRPGTEALPLIAGFGAAVQALPALSEGTAHAAALRNLLLDKLNAMDGITVNSPDDGLPYILNFSVPGIRSETMLHHLAQHGVYVSSGSACARGHKSHVLEAMKLSDDRIDSAIRVSFGHQNTEEDVLQLTDALQEGLATLTRRRER